MSVTNNDAEAHFAEGSENTDLDVEKQDTNTPDPHKPDIEHVLVKDDPRTWSRNRKVCTLYSSHQHDGVTD